MRITFLSVEQVEEIHDNQIELYGGHPGIRDRGSLESAVAVPRATFGGKLLYPSMFLMAAAYLHGLANNHPFIDGNKRCAMMTVVVFLQMNGFELEVGEDELVEFTVKVITERLTREVISEFLENHSVTARS